MQQGLFDIGWSDESECQACHKEKAQKNTGSTIAQNGTRPDGRSQGPTENVNKKRKPRRKSGSGKGVLSRILSMNANGTEATSV